MQAVGIKEVSMADSEDEASDPETGRQTHCAPRAGGSPSACVGRMKGMGGCCAQYLGPLTAWNVPGCVMRLGSD